MTATFDGEGQTGQNHQEQNQLNMNEKHVLHSGQHRCQPAAHGYVSMGPLFTWGTLVNILKQSVHGYQVDCFGAKLFLKCSRNWRHYRPIFLALLMGGQAEPSAGH